MMTQPQLIASAVAVFIALVSAITTSRLLAALVRRGHLPEVMALRVRKGVWWLMALFSGMFVLQHTHLFEQAWAVLSAMLVALAVAFVALWSILSNSVGALLILAFRPFRLGDRIEVIEPSDTKAGVGGRVIDLSLMFTTMEVDEPGPDRTLIRMPNTVFFQKAVKVTFPRHVSRATFFEVAPPTAPVERASKSKARAG